MKKRLLLCLAIAAFAFAGCATMPQDVKLEKEGYRQLKANNYFEAYRCYQQAYDLNDKNPYVLLNLGIINAHFGRKNEARFFYKELIALNPPTRAVTGTKEGVAGKRLVDMAKENLVLLNQEK